MFTKLFFKDFAERLIATLAQVSLGLLTADQATSISAKAWLITLGVSALGVFVKAVGANKVDGTLSPASLAPVAPDLPAVSEEEVAAHRAGAPVDLETEFKPEPYAPLDPYKSL